MYLRNNRRHKSLQGENGNVLFLILIAVALFAALGYAVVQSTLSNGGDTAKEKETMDVAQILTVPSSYRTVTDRMIVSQGIDGGGIIATSPANFNSLTAEQKKHDIYHPDGGGLPYPLPPKHMMADAYNTNEWAFNSENEVKNIGKTTTIPDESSVELMVFLPGLKKSVCEAINRKLGITGAMPVSYADFTLNASSDPPAYMENGGAALIGGTASDAQLTGKAQGCFQSASLPDLYVFYSVILDR